MKKMISVEPLKTVGGVAFGMSRDAVRGVFGPTFREFKKSKFSANTTDDFGFAHVFYDAGNTCVAVELFDDCVVSVGTACLLPCDRRSFCDWLRTADGESVVLDSDATSVALSIGAAFAGEGVESLLFGKAGYYAW